jgi:CMP-N,N'-diacetyllegionaminic acid synthase
MNILCTICMRGGSKGIKNKNIIKINKKYLFQYTHEIALKCKKITDIVFSTDSNKIINILSKEKKNVIFKRSKSLATDNISKVDVIQDSLIKAEKFYKKKYSYIIDLDVTSPLRNLSDINKSIEIMKKGNFNNLFSVNKSKKNPYFNMVEKKITHMV